MQQKITAIIVFALVFCLFGQVVQASGIHVVRPGETLWQVARLYHTTVEALATENGLHNPDHIVVGQRLAVPGLGIVHTVQRGDTVWQIAQRYGVTVTAVSQANNLSDANYIEVGDRLVIPGKTATQATALPSRAGRTFSAPELDLFARLVHAEAAGEPYAGQVAVAASVLNRLDSPLFPNTLTGVIYQVVSGFYQYSPVLDGRINLPANESARQAVRDALAGSDPSLGATGFYNPRKTTNAWVRQQPVTTIIGNHVFFR